MTPTERALLFAVARALMALLENREDRPYAELKRALADASAEAAAAEADEREGS